MIKEKGKILIIADDQRFTSDIQELVKKNSGSFEAGVPRKSS